MITLNDAITKRFPQGNEWASEALAVLSDDIEPTSLVHEVAEGWMRRGAGASAELIDTLFVLTSDRLGLGRTDRDGDEPQWIELRSIVAVDAVDDSPLPLQTIELEHGDDLVVCIGWPEAFTERFIGVLVALAGGPDPGESAAETMPWELIDPTALVDDVSDLDSLSPSEWVEGSVAPAADVTVAEPDTIEPIEPIESAAPGRRPRPQPNWGSRPSPRPVAIAPSSQRSTSSTRRPLPSRSWSRWRRPSRRRRCRTRSRSMSPLPRRGRPSIVSTTPSRSRPTPSRSPTRRSRPARSRPFPVETVPVETGPFEAASGTFDPGALGDWMQEPVEPAPPTREASFTAGPPPWQAPGAVWPDPLRGVLYLGGHPGHPRKRKNGTMMFSPNGLEVAGSGFQSWEMNMDWAFVHSMEIQGPDEIMFGDHLKIDSTSSALIITMVDETRMFFEIRTRRPPSLRAALAPVLLMVENIRSHRANG
ncbi:MAG: hypothetical protein V9G12_09585 [Microthrixaceae bacterium]